MTKCLFLSYIFLTPFNPSFPVTDFFKFLKSTESGFVSTVKVQVVYLNSSGEGSKTVLLLSLLFVKQNGNVCDCQLLENFQIRMSHLRLFA